MDGQLSEIIWQVADDASFTRLVASGTAATHAERDYTVKVDATGLEAGKRYFYRFRVNGEYSYFQPEERECGSQSECDGIY